MNHKSFSFASKAYPKTGHVVFYTLEIIYIRNNKNFMF